MDHAGNILEFSLSRRQSYLRLMGCILNPRQRLRDIRDMYTVVRSAYRDSILDLASHEWRWRAHGSTGVVCVLLGST